MNQIVVAVVEITVLIIPIIIVVDVVDAEEDNINKKVAQGHFFHTSVFLLYLPEQHLQLRIARPEP
mgnify:CR=1 FL=1